MESDPRPQTLIEQLQRRCAELERELEALRERQQQRLAVAAIVHRSLLPRPVRHERVWIDVRYVPVEQIGGDYCQVRFSDQVTCYITMCDVTGHDVAAALLATRISSEVRYGILYRRDPVEIVRSLERFTGEYFSETGLLLSFVAARIDLERMELTWSGAGHPSPLLIRQKTREVECLKSQHGLIGMGLIEADGFHQDTVALRSGDRLFFLTDGVLEVFDAQQRQLGFAGFTEVAKSTMDCEFSQVADQVLQAVRQYQYGPNTDDQTLIVADIR